MRGRYPYEALNRLRERRGGVSAAFQEDVDFVGISTLSASCMELLPKIKVLLRENGSEDIKLLLGGVIVDNDLLAFEKLDVRVFPSGSKMKEIADYMKNNA